MGSAAGREAHIDEAEGEHTVQLAFTHLMSVAGVACYHTSVIVDEFEYYFDSLGIMAAPPLWSHLQAQAKKGVAATAIKDYGTCSKSGLAMAHALRPHFAKQTYDLLYKNCNHFSDAALYYLNRSRMEGKLTRLERFATSTDPVSTTLMNNILRAVIQHRTGEPCERDIYVTNPHAKEFSLAQVFAEVDDEEDSSDDEDGEADINISCADLSNIPCLTRDIVPQRTKWRS